MKKLLAAGLVAILVTGSVYIRIANSNTDSDDESSEPEKSAENIEANVDARPFLDYSGAIENIDPEGDPIPVTAKLLKHGEWVFRGMCIGCHGATGEGDGAVWELADKYSPEHKLPRKPRNFTEAVYKIRSTPSGSLPTDVDLFRSISRGLVADQDMPAFKYLPERDRWAVIAYIKSLSDIWVEEEEYQEDPIEVTEPPIPDAQMLVAGKDVYGQMKCAKCHGELGKGDGPSAPDLEDDNGLPIVPRDFSDETQFVGGSDPKSVFQTFNTGFDGTPMPSFLDFLDAEQSWQLVWYVTSLRPEFDLQATRKEMMLARGETVVAAVDSGTVMTDVADAQASPEGSDTESNTELTEQTEANEDTEVEEEEKEENQQANAEDGATESDEDAESSASQEAAESEETATESTQAEQVASNVDSSTEPAKEQSSAKFLGDYKEIELGETGAISGTVVYNGSVKKRTVLPSKDKDICGKTRKVPVILVGDGGAVQDSVVYLKDVTEGKSWPDTAMQVPVLDQKNCQFVPHVQVGRQGDLDIVNSDPVLHNTHGYYGKRTAFNVALPEKDQKVTKTLKRPGTVKVDCDAHGWMLGWVQVVDNPYYYQTGEDGTFTIDEIPVGDYTLVVWQEELGETEVSVTVAAGETTDLDVELKK